MQNPAAAMNEENQRSSSSDQLSELNTMFVQKYDEPIEPAKLTHLITKYGFEIVKNVIGKMKPDAYEPDNYLAKCLDSGWYKNDGKQQAQEGKASTTNGMSNAAADTIRFTWNFRMDKGWIDKTERDFMLDVLLNGATKDEERIRDINFRCLQGMYPNAPAMWFYWLPQHKRRAVANTWIAQSKREDLQPYELA